MLDNKTENKVPKFKIINTLVGSKLKTVRVPTSVEGYWKFKMNIIKRFVKEKKYNELTMMIKTDSFNKMTPTIEPIKNDVICRTDTNGQQHYAPQTWEEAEKYKTTLNNLVNKGGIKEAAIDGYNFPLDKEGNYYTIYTKEELEVIESSYEVSDEDVESVFGSMNDIKNNNPKVFKGVFTQPEKIMSEEEKLRSEFNELKEVVSQLISINKDLINSIKKEQKSESMQTESENELVTKSPKNGNGCYVI